LKPRRQPFSNDLTPAYLRFVRGVIDYTDLPLNISRDVHYRRALDRAVFPTAQA